MADNGRRGTALCPLTVGQAAVLVRVFSVLVGNNDALAGMAVAKDPLPTEPRPAFVARHPYFEPQQHPIVIDCHLEGQGERPPLPPFARQLALSLGLANSPTMWCSGGSHHRPRPQSVSWPRVDDIRKPMEKPHLGQGKTGRPTSRQQCKEGELDPYGRVLGQLGGP